MVLFCADASVLQERRRRNVCLGDALRACTEANCGSVFFFFSNSVIWHLRNLWNLWNSVELTVHTLTVSVLWESWKESCILSRRRSGRHRKAWRLFQGELVVVIVSLVVVNPQSVFHNLCFHLCASVDICLLAFEVCATTDSSSKWEGTQEGY